MFSSLRAYIGKHGLFLGLQGVMFLGFFACCAWFQNQVFSTIGTETLPHAGFRYWLPVGVAGLALILFRRLRWMFLSLNASILFFVTTADQLYFSYFKTLPTLTSKIPMSQSLVVWESALGLLQWHYLGGIGLLLLFFYYGYKLYRSDHYTERGINMLLGKASGGLLLLVAGSLYMVATVTPIQEVTHHIGRNPNILPESHWGAHYSNLDYARVFGLVGYHLHDFSRSRTDAPLPSSEDETARFATMLERANGGVQEPNLHGIAAGYNVIIIQMEAIQYWLVGAVYEGIEVTPFLNSLYRDQPHWNQIYDTTFIGRTADAEFALNTGMMPDLEVASAFTYTNRDLFTFPRALKEQGYATLSFHGFKKDFWNRTNTHPMYGIETMMFMEDFPSSPKLGLGIADKDLFPLVAAHLQTVAAPFYANIISLSCHHPFREQPENVADLFPKLSQTPGMGPYSGYLNLARYTDEAVQELVGDLRERGILEKSLVVIYGDHDMGVMRSNMNLAQATKTDQLLKKHLGVNPYQAIQDKVPLALILPEPLAWSMATMQTYSERCATLCDLFPSIFYLLGEPIPKGIVGAPFFSAEPGVIALPPYFDFLRKKQYQRALDRDNLYLAGSTRGYRYALRDGKEEQIKAPFTVVDAAANLRYANDYILRRDAQASFRDP